jgi:hypothetical protein
MLTLSLLIVLLVGPLWVTTAYEVASARIRYDARVRAGYVEEYGGEVISR